MGVSAGERVSRGGMFTKGANSFITYRTVDSENTFYCVDKNISEGKAPAYPISDFFAEAPID